MPMPTEEVGLRRGIYSKEAAPLGILSTVPLGVVRAGAEDGLGLLLGALLCASADASDSWLPAAGPVLGPPPVERSVLVILEGEDASDLLALVRRVYWRSLPMGVPLCMVVLSPGMAGKRERVMPFAGDTTG